MNTNPTQLAGRQHGTLYIWALGVGIVVCGQYFGWSGGLAGNGPVAMLLASLLVCLLFLAWVLTLAELSVAMPRADGPLEYGRRAGGDLLGFVMGWSMLLECQFGAIATALASGSAVAFLCNPEHPDPVLKFWAGLGTVGVFFFLQAWGFREQAWTQILMTCAALLGLCLYWGIAVTDFSWDRAWPGHDLLAGKGWDGVLDALPYALWWLIIIEGVALAAEETRSPERSIPRGLVFGMVTIIAMMLLTLGLGCGALDWRELMTETEYPLAAVVLRVLDGQSPVLLFAFAGIALFGLIASYHGLYYSASRQAFSLGRAGFLPGWLGRVHATRRTPVPALLLSGLVTAGFLVSSLWFSQAAVEVAILTAGLASLIWYVLAMVCLFRLRQREPGLFRRYQAPLRRTLPVLVLILSLFTICVYAGINVQVLPLTAVLYFLGLACFYTFGRGRSNLAPSGESLIPGGEAVDPLQVGSLVSTPGSVSYRYLEGFTAAVLVLLLLAVGWMVLAAFDIDLFRLASVEWEVYSMLLILGVALLSVGTVALIHARVPASANDPNGESE